MNENLWSTYETIQKQMVINFVAPSCLYHAPLWWQKTALNIRCKIRSPPNAHTNNCVRVIKFSIQSQPTSTVAGYVLPRDAVLDKLLANTHLTTRWSVQYTMGIYEGFVIHNMFAQQYTELDIHLSFPIVYSWFHNYLYQALIKGKRI